jgi:AsmA protein
MLKKLLLIIISLLVLLAIVAITAPHFIPEDAFKGQITSQLNKALDREVTVGGTMKIKVFPFAGLHMEDVTIAGFSKADPLATVKSFDVEVALLPLIKKEIVIQSLILKEPQIHLKVNAAGNSNWQLDRREPGVAGQKESGDAAAPQNLMLGNVKISDGLVDYHNAKAKEEWSLNKLNMEASLKGISEPFEARGAAEWNGKPIKANAEIGSLQEFLFARPAKAIASIKSDLLTLDADGEIKNNIFTGKLYAKSSSLRDFMAWVKPGVKPSSLTAPMALSLSSTAECAATYCNMAGTSLTLDDIQAKGEVKASWGEAIPHVEVNLTAGQINLDPFLPPEKKQASLFISNAAAAEDWSTEPMDFSYLRDIDVNANIKAEGLRARGITIGKAALQAKVQRGRLSGDVTDAEFYSGKANVSFNVDASGAVPTFDKRVTLQHIQVEPFLKDATGSDRLSGTADLQMSASSSGQSQREIVSSLQGSGQFKVTDGAFKGFNIADMVRNIQSAYKNVDTSSQKTDFAELGGTFTIAHGIISNNDLAMKAPLIRLTGQGQVNLPQKSIGYHLMPQIVQTAQGQGGKEKQGIAVPIIVEGPLDKPAFRPDVQGVVEQAIKDPEKLKEQLKNSKGSIKDVTKDVKGLLKGFR